MPNWCNNSMSVEGDPATIKRFLNAVTDEEGKISILNRLVPVPQELRDTPSGFFGDSDKQREMELQNERNLVKYGHKDWYDWQYAEWGTKWGDCDTELTNEDTTNDGKGWLNFVFESAWGCPAEGIRKVSIMFPDLTFIVSYMEEGMGFVGANGFKAGNMIERFSENIHVDGLPEGEINDEWFDLLHDAYYKERDRCESEVIRELENIS